MSDEKQEGQKTIVSFIVGLLIGGLLVWAFSGPAVDAPTNESDEQETEETTDDEEMTEEETTDNAEIIENSKGGQEVAKLPIGEGKISVDNQAAGSIVLLKSATYPVAEGWIGVRDYQSNQLGGLLGVARFSEAQGLVPTAVPLQRATVAGKEYAIVIYTESGDLKFSLADDVQLDSVFTTFTAQ